MHRFAPAGSPQQQAPGKELAEGGGQRGTGDSHVEPEDEQRVEDHIQYGSAHDAYHAEMGVALQTQLVVEREGRHHEGGGNEYEA